MKTLRLAFELNSQTRTIRRTLSSRRSRNNLQHFDYGRKRHSDINKNGYIVFGIATGAGIGSAVIMARCEGKTEIVDGRTVI